MAQVIRLFRAALGDTQREFAKRMGLALTSVGRYETNSRPSSDVLSKFAKAAEKAKLAIFVEIFEGRVAPEDAELDMVEVSAATHEAYAVLDRTGFDQTDLKRLKLMLWLWSAPVQKLAKIESAFKADFSANVDELVFRTAGAILRGRQPEIEQKRIEFLRDKTAQKAVDFILAFEEHRRRAREAGDGSPMDISAMSLKWFNSNPREQAGIISRMLADAAHNDGGAFRFGVTTTEVKK